MGASGLYAREEGALRTYLLYFCFRFGNNEHVMHEGLIQDVKFNCDVSDAKYWGYFSICGLLMRYRDLFRSERGFKPWADISRTDIAEWIEKKEERWPELEEEPFRELTIAGGKYHPFDSVAINNALNKQCLIYGAGYGMYMKPTFFLAELRAIKSVSGHTVYTSNREYVRDLFTSPAMLQESNIFIRLEPLKILLTYKFFEMSAGRGFALKDAFLQYGFLHRQLIDDTFEKRLEAMAERYAETLLCHELAEAEEDALEWKDVLAAADDRKAEHYVRAVKDLVADTSGHGPFKRAIETRDRGALSLSIGLMEGYRTVLYPEIKTAYTEFLSAGAWDVIEEARKAGYARFIIEREKIIALYKNIGKDNFAATLRGLIDQKADSGQ